MEPKLTFTFAVSEAQMIIDALSELKYKECYHLIDRIRHEGEAQIQQFKSQQQGQSVQPIPYQEADTVQN